MVSDVDDETIKLADFGFATIVEGGGNSLSDYVGTPGYLAPEIYPFQDGAVNPTPPPAYG